MKIRDILSEADESKLSAKMIKEYWRADLHTKSWKSSVQNVGRDYLFKEVEQDKVQVRVIEWLLRKRKSVLLSDEIQVTNVPMNWALWEEIAENANSVLQFNYRSFDMKWKYEEVIVDDWLQGVWCLAVDGWNDHDQEPIVSYIDSRLCFPDPSNWRGNRMKFFWTLLQHSIYTLESDEAYDQERIAKIKDIKSEEIKQINRDNGKFQEVDLGDEMVDTYNHITIFKSSKDKTAQKYLTTWSVDRTVLVRVVRMKALTATEIADPSQISLWVSLFRAHPIKWSFAWASLIDDSGQFQDLKTMMTNLLIYQAIEAWLWGKTFVDSELWVDVDAVATAWPAVIPYRSENPHKNAANSIIHETARPNNPAAQNWIDIIDRLNEEATDMSSIASGQSLSGTQTKAEIQTLQQNINQGIQLMADSYLTTLIVFWEDVVGGYEANMSSQRTKDVVVVNGAWAARKYWFKKNEFIGKWGAYITLTSKAQEAIKQAQDFAKLAVVYGTIRPLFPNESYQANVLDRLYINTSGVRGLDASDIVTYSLDEEKALWNVKQLNKNIELSSKPQPWENHDVYIQIYKKGIPTEARDKAIVDRKAIKAAEPKQDNLPTWEADWTAKSLWASLLASENAQDWGVTSLSDAAV